MSHDPRQPYPKVPTRADYPAIERRLLARWEAGRVFERSVEARPGGDNEYIFYDGPPFANGLPHYGHILCGYVKDVVPRYQTMRGRRVERRFGWDCHGLPAEIEAEKELGVSGRRAIAEYGIDRFNEYCRTSVLRYTHEWERYVTRQARWVDFANDYKTMDLSYMESVMWAFKQLWDKGLVYEALRVMPYSWGAETPLSNFEIRLDDATRPRQDPAITVAFALDPRPGDDGPMAILVWTTTPWTLPSNLAVAVGADITYDLVRLDGTTYVIGADTVAGYDAQLGAGERIGSVTGADLVGRTYRPPFGFFAALAREGAFRVLAGDFVDTSEGTGLVHIAPGFGEDDQRVAEANGVPMVVPVDESGRFTADVPDWQGENVLEANPHIIRALKEQGALVRHDSYTHNYPHCWRTDTPIIYRALSSWYVRVTDVRDRMVELNQRINWIPDHVRDGAFGKWLAGARDWSISRNRFWGSPIPIWKSDDPDHPRIDVYGSLDELERDFGVRPADLHRPTIDALTRPNPDDPTGRSTMRRVPEVLDCWFESGSMPFAQVHYPFENAEWFESHLPADFIVEYLPQTRGWFYTLHVLSTALFDRQAFDNVICHGVVLDEDGRKLSKRLRNYPDPEEVFELHGADALRWFLMSSPILRGLDLRIDRHGAGIAEVVRLVLNPIWNAFHFFTLYANADGYRASLRTDSADVLDRYVLAKTGALVEAVTARLDAYDLAGACAEVTGFLDALNNWYIRRSRERFWAPEAAAGAVHATVAGSKADAFDTLATVLVTLSRVIAPLLPLVADEVHSGLTSEESVHLTDWPDATNLPADAELVAAMDRVREICSVGLSLREDRSLRTRLPLARLTVAGPDTAALAPFADLIVDEVNVKAVDFATDVSDYGTFVLRPDGRVLGPRLGGDTQKVMAAARVGEWRAGDGGSVEVAGHVLGPGDFELALQPSEGEAIAALRSNDTVVVLDTDVTAALAAEGTARDLVRMVQQARKAADLDVTDRIALRLSLPEPVAAAVIAHERHLADQVLATSVHYTDGALEREGRLAGEPIWFGFTVEG
ncbi:isoleucine--tRNA ligase [soil metagenome]